MNMGKARWVRDYRISYKRRLADWVIAYTGIPTTLQHFRNHGTLALDVTTL